MAKRSRKHGGIASFAVELVLYGCFISVYFFLVLRFLGGWLKQAFDTNRGVYAIVALGLIVAQGAALETVTRLLLQWIRRRLD